MEYAGAAILVIIIFYKLFGQKYFNKKLLESMIERIATPALAFPSSSKEEKIIAMHFYYACLIFTCQKRNLSRFTRTLVDMAFRKTLTDVYNYKDLPEEVYQKKLSTVFNIIGFLEKYPHPEVLNDLIVTSNKKAKTINGINLTFDTLNVFTKSNNFYIKSVGSSVDFLLETNKQYPV